MEVALEKYDAACKALEEAVSTDEVKNILDLSVAYAAYARQAKNRDLELKAEIIRKRATRRLGQIMRMQKETVGLATGTKGQLRGRNSSGGSVVDPPENTPTLAEAGIDKHLADSARRAEKLSQDEFEQVITNIMKKGGKRKKRSISQKHNGKKGKNQVDTSEYIKRLNDGSQAMHLVETAILHLKRIEDKDPKRIEALKYINKWIKTQLKGGTK